ncbi:hypothetical protein P22_2235 [Propionispora sp. 2/2-37]|uniref:YlmC/YmxH family sporulation protein n=1 Tax=Propionispora sp. 2/2-37 TaxID=1677858 RepID=UPI0006BB965E|nr:YlmC/YmxH family sporulation protein [Propionispora sp. 2/2-37]CUH96147.1 hypothetical protein P22_2235 [Propionispora sp. 2/2-37]
MRLSELSGKEVINLGDGARMGIISECELTFNEATGEVDAILLPTRQGLMSFLGESKVAAIPWKSIKKIGDDVIIIDLNYLNQQTNKRLLHRFNDTY